MTKTLWKKLFVPAVITMALGSSVLSAQTSGVGCDGSTRFLWRGTDSRISLWRVDASLNNPISHQYGPYDGWVPVAMTVLCNNYTYVLWKHTNGSISLWEVDPNLVFVNNRVYGPYDGWIPESLSPDQTAGGNFRVLWRETTGLISIWVVGPNLNLNFNKIYGPYFGFDPTADAVRVARPADASSKEATESMKVTTGSVRMPE